MDITIIKIKRILWFIAIILMAFSFPIQVYFNSPIPSLAPYLVISVIILLSLVTKHIEFQKLFRWNFRTAIEQVITVFIVLVLFQTGWQKFFHLISSVSAITAVIIFIFPVVFYIYFRNAFTENEIRAILFSIAIAGLVVGIYFAYDSVSKLIFGKLPIYDLVAHDYSITRMGQNWLEANPTRVELHYRSMGLLESHSISAAWINIGCFAALTFPPHSALQKRALILSIYGFLLIIGLNFTGIVGFVLTVFLFEFYASGGFMSTRSLIMLISSLSYLAAIMLILFLFIGFDFVQVIYTIIHHQYNIVTGTHVTSNNHFGFFGGALSQLISFPSNMMLKFPLGFFIGDGFTPEFGVIIKGGDYGFSETLHRLGLPLFVAIFIGLAALIRRSLHQTKYFVKCGSKSAFYLQFASSVILYISFNEIHYSIWSAKSIFPVFFLCLAIFHIYLPASFHRNEK